MRSITIARALTARISLRVLRLATMIVAIVFGVWLVVTAALVYFFSPWWWLLLVPAVVLLAIVTIIRLVVRFIIGRIHGGRMSKQQAEALDGFVDKIQALLEARATPPWMFAAICIKDLLIHRDVTTIKSIIGSTTTLKRDYQELEKLF
jgi:hypothetical protein